MKLDHVPSLPGLYGTGAAAAARDRVFRKQAAEQLPWVRHEVDRVPVDVGELTRYQHLLGEPARDCLPSGFIHALAFPVAMSVMTADDFPLPLLGMIHLRNQVEHYRTVLFSERLDISAWPRNMAAHRSGTQVKMVAEVRSSAELVWRGVSTYLAKGVHLPGLDEAPEENAPRSGFAPPVPTAKWLLGADTGRAYAAVSGDFNPIHLSAITAKALGMRASIAHGMYLASRALATARPEGVEAFSWDIDFAAPVFLPATVALSVRGPEGTRHGGTGAGSGTEYVGWNPRSGRKHFSGSVTPLPH